MKAFKIIIVLFAFLSSCILPDDDETMAEEPIFFVNQSDLDIYTIFYYDSKIVETGSCYAETMFKVDKPIPLGSTIKILVFNLADVEECKKGNIPRPPRIGELEMTLSMLRKQDMIVKYPFVEQ